MKAELDRCLSSLGSPNRYGVFSFPGFKEHKSLYEWEEKLRKIVFDVPCRPYIVNPSSPKKFLLIMEPLNILYRYNKKEETIQIEPAA